MRTESNSPVPGGPSAVGREGRQAATIYDVAKLAGVNASTVSRALSQPGRISAKTDKKVQDAVKALNYRVNPVARALPTGRTKTIGLLVADITNPVFFDIARGAERAAATRDYTLVLAESAESPETELLAAQRLLAVADGVVLATSRLSDDQIRQLSQSKPVVVINREVADVPSVMADIETGISQAVRHLFMLAHKSVAYVAGPERSWMSRRRWEIINDRCNWSNISAVPIGGSAPTVEGGRKAAMKVLESGATAVIAYNDLVAIGLMQEMVGGGKDVPDDISIIGFDNIFGSDFTTPPLTTISSPLAEMGASAIELVLRAVGATEGAGDIGDLATELLIRGSTGKVRIPPR
ncbi:LacI family transcriptional regulator [Arthrobacter pigmenti]|uniref:LacI family transcriptional regulator n=1 Tax=Arthrobacter pigmenti TaxID=271432 RepID=A0A846RJ01_9MICC|nr:LacI family transcriptional regulator [Arthrobacter pigmenti]